jgi:thiamine biosynthesis lipoprotein
MPKMSTDLVRHALNGPTMGTRWAALLDASATIDAEKLRSALAEAADRVDREMSTFKPESDLMRLNAAPPGVWVDLPTGLTEVLAQGLEIGRASDGAFDVGLGDLVDAWGFGPRTADPDAIRARLGRGRPPAHELLDLEVRRGKIRKRAGVQLDLSGIAKGYAVDRMVQAIERFGIASALVSLDGELRAIGTQANGRPWTIAVEEPVYEARAAMSVLTLQDVAVATSGDYRHWVDIGGRRLSHTMDARTGGPLNNGVASVTVLAPTCTEADAWATALMVMGPDKGVAFAAAHGLNALYILRTRDGLVRRPAGTIFAPERMFTPGPWGGTINPAGQRRADRQLRESEVPSQARIRLAKHS